MIRTTTIVAALFATCCGVLSPSAEASDDAKLPRGVTRVWDMGKAHRESTPTRERICINGLWRWQPAKNPSGAVPD